MFVESRKNRRGMSYPKRPRRTKSTCASSPSENAKIIRNIETTKQKLEQLAEKYKGINVVDGFLTDLWYALGIQNQGEQKNGGKPSRYALYQMQDGTMLLISIRASGHNANANKYVEHPPVPDKNLSIVLQKKMRRNQFKPNPSVNLGEYVYVNQKIRNVENPLSKIAYSLINYLDTGQYKDLTGVAIPHGNITENINYNRIMNKNRIRLTESQLRQIIKESVDSILKEGSKKKDPMSQWFNDFNKASKFRETMDYVNKGGRNPLSKNKNENLNDGDVRFIPHLQRDIETLHSLYEKWQYAENKPEGIDGFIDAVRNSKHIMQDIKSSLADCEY